MFVPFTTGSELAKPLRKNEEKLVKLSGNEVKIVKRTGTKLQDLLTRANPWKGYDCERENCLLCYTKQNTEKSRTQDCHQRSIVYETRCLDAKKKNIPRQNKWTSQNNIGFKEKRAQEENKII